MVPKLLYTAAPGEVKVDPALLERELALDEAPWDPVMCARCGRPASPYVDTVSGPCCFRCFDGGGGDDHPTPTLAGAMTLLDRTHWRLIAARAALALETLTLAGAR